MRFTEQVRARLFHLPRTQGQVRRDASRVPEMPAGWATVCIPERVEAIPAEPGDICLISSPEWRISQCASAIIYTRRYSLPFTVNSVKG